MAAATIETNVAGNCPRLPSREQPSWRAVPWLYCSLASAGTGMSRSKPAWPHCQAVSAFCFHCRIFELSFSAPSFVAAGWWGHLSGGLFMRRRNRFRKLLGNCYENFGKFSRCFPGQTGGPRRLAGAFLIQLRLPTCCAGARRFGGDRLEGRDEHSKAHFDECDNLPGFNV